MSFELQYLPLQRSFCLSVFCPSCLSFCKSVFSLCLRRIKRIYTGVDRIQLIIQRVDSRLQLIPGSRYFFAGTGQLILSAVQLIFGILDLFLSFGFFIVILRQIIFIFLLLFIKLFLRFFHCRLTSCCGDSLCQILHKFFCGIKLICIFFRKRFLLPVKCQIKLSIIVDIEFRSVYHEKCFKTAVSYIGRASLIIKIDRSINSTHDLIFSVPEAVERILVIAVCQNYGISGLISLAIYMIIIDDTLAGLFGESSADHSESVDFVRKRDRLVGSFITFSCGSQNIDLHRALGVCHALFRPGCINALIIYSVGRDKHVIIHVMFVKIATCRTDH